MKKIKGVSVQSMVIGSIITGIIASAALAFLWGSVEKSKVYTIAETLDEQHAFIVSDAENNYETIFNANLEGNNDYNYLDDLIRIGKISKPPLDFFVSKNIEWEIRMVNDSGLYPNFYIYLNSDMQEDLDLFEKAINHHGYLENNFFIIQP